MAFFKSSDHAVPAGAVTVPVSVVDKVKLREAYDKGRVDERKRHHRSPVLTVSLVLIALVGAVVLFYAFREGSFAGGGAAVDNKLAQVGSQAVPAVESAAAKAGTIAEQAGDKLKSQGQAIKQDTAPTDAQPASGQPVTTPGER